jgi:hypothetical protein
MICNILRTLCNINVLYGIKCDVVFINWMCAQLHINEKYSRQYNMQKHIKGTVPRKFRLLVFFMNQFPQAPENTIRAVLFFFKNSRRYSQINVHMLCHHLNIFAHAEHFHKNPFLKSSFWANAECALKKILAYPSKY